jgi:hypothetical protein
MSDDAIIILCIFSAFVLFGGDPDLMDALITFLSK